MSDNQDKYFNSRVNQIGASAAFKEAEAAGVFDREDAAARDAVNHADKWLNGVKHLYSQEQVDNMSKLIRHGKRGSLSANDINLHMGLIAGSAWQPWEPDTSSNLDVPDHLGPQFG